MATRRRIEIDLSVIDADSVRAALGGVVQQLASAERHAMGLKRAIDSINRSPGAGVGGQMSQKGQASIHRQAMRDEAAMSRLRERLKHANEQAQLRSAKVVEAERRRELAKTDRQKAVAERQAQRQSVLAAKAEARAKALSVRESERLATIDRKNSVANARHQAALERRADRGFGRSIDRERQRVERNSVRAGRVAERERIGLGRAVIGGALAPARAVSGVAGTAGRIVAGGLAIGGAAGVYDIVRKSISNEGLAGDIENLTNGKYSSEQIMALSGASAKTTGIANSDVLAGLSTFIARTGDADTGMRNLPTFARVSRATGADVSEIAATAADLSTKFNVKSVEDMTNALGMLTQQGKDGSFELRDMAKQFPKIGAAASNYGLQGISGVKQLGGFAQIARRGVGNSESAATSVEQFFNQLAKKNSKLEKGEYGRKFSIWQTPGDQTSGSKDLLTMIPELIDSVDGNMGSMIKILDARGNRAVSTLLPIYHAAYKNSSGTNEQRRAAAREAVRNELVKTINVQGDAGMLDRDYKRRMGKTDAQLGVAGQTLGQEIGLKLLPVIQEAIPKFSEMIPALVELTANFVEAAPAIIDFATGLAQLGLTAMNWAAENPVKAALAAVALSIGKAVLVHKATSAVSSVVGGVLSGGGLAGGALTTGGFAAGGTAIAARTGVGALGAGAGLVGALVGAGMFASEARDYASSEERKDDTVASVRMGAAVDKYVRKWSGDPEKMAKLEQVKQEIAGGGYLGKESRAFVSAYLGDASGLDSKLLSSRVDGTDREKMVQVIDRSVQSKKAFAQTPTDAPLTDEEMMAFGFSPQESARIREQNGDPPAAGGGEPVAADQLSEASTALLASAAAIKDAAGVQRDASQHLRDTLAQRGVFR